MDLGITGCSSPSEHRDYRTFQTSGSFADLPSGSLTPSPGRPRNRLRDLPKQFQRELNLSCRSGAQNLHKSRGANTRVVCTSESTESSAGASSGRRKVYVVEDVEKLLPKLQG